MAQTDTAVMAPPLTNGMMAPTAQELKQKAKKSSSPAPGQIVKYVRDVNDHLTCYICKGYYIDATTIVECLHSFCRSCIIKRLQFKSYCPVCEIMINKAKPNIKPDKILQDIVYKLVPGLHRDEMRRRREFYNNHVASAVTSSVILDDGITSEQRGEDNERVIYNSTDLVSLSLEYYNEPENQCDIYSTTVNNNTEIVATKKRKADHESEEEDELHKTNEKPLTRFLQCPAGLTIRLLKKFLIQKYDIDVKLFHVDILYKRVPLPDDYKLLDIAYIYSWKRVEPMRIFYRVTDIKYAINRFDFFNPCTTEEAPTPPEQQPAIKTEENPKPAKESSPPPKPIKQEEKPIATLEPPKPTQPTIKTPEPAVKTEPTKTPSPVPPPREKSPTPPKPPPKSPSKSPEKPTVKKVTFETPSAKQKSSSETKKVPESAIKKLTIDIPTSPKQSKPKVPASSPKQRKTPSPKHNPFFPPKSPKKQKLSAVVSSSEQVSESEKQKRIFLNTFQLTSTQNVPRPVISKPPTPTRALPPPPAPTPTPPAMEEVSSTSQIRPKRKYTFKTRPMSKKSKLAAEAAAAQKTQSLKTLFDNCKLTIPSSLSITLSGQSESTSTPNDTNQPMFIEIIKIPEKKKELSPPPLANISKNREMTKIGIGNFKVTTTGIQSLGMHNNKRLVEPQKPQTGFQKMFEEAIKRKEIPAPSTPGIKIPSAKKIKLETALDLSSSTTPPRLSLLPTSAKPTKTPAKPTAPLGLLQPTPKMNLVQTKNLLQTSTKPAKLIPKPILPAQPSKKHILPTPPPTKPTSLLQPAKTTKNTQSNQITSTDAKLPPAKITPLSKITQSGALSPTEIQNQYNLTNLAQLQQVMMLRKQLEYRRNSLSKLLQPPPQQKPPGSPRPSASDRHDTNAAALMHFEKYMKSLQQPTKLTIPKSPVPNNKNLPSPKQVVPKNLPSPKGSPTTPVARNLPSPLSLPPSPSPKPLGPPAIVPKSLPSPTSAAKNLVKK